MVTNASECDIIMIYSPLLQNIPKIPNRKKGDHHLVEITQTDRVYAALLGSLQQRRI